VFLWETLMARRDFETSDGGRDEDEKRKDSRGSIQKNDPGSIPGECGDGTLFLHVVPPRLSTADTWFSPAPNPTTYSTRRTTPCARG